jgi:hypothetical protein
MKKVEFIARQGDVYIFRVDEFPKGEGKQDELTIKKQLALGEISGHAHAFEETAPVELFKIDAFEELTFIDIKENCKLIHGLLPGYENKTIDNDYHWSIDLKKGKYISGIVEETDWITGTIRKVID